MSGFFGVFPILDMYAKDARVQRIYLGEQLEYTAPPPFAYLTRARFELTTYPVEFVTDDMIQTANFELTTYPITFGQRLDVNVAHFDLTTYPITFVQPAIEIDFLESRAIAGAATVQTYIAVDFGAEDAGREIVVILGHNNSTGATRGWYTGVTIGGVTAVCDVQHSASLNASQCEIWRAQVPTGLNGNVVATIDASGGNANRWVMGAWRLTKRAVPNAGPADFAVQRANYVASPAPQVAFDVPANGVYIAGCQHVNASATAWSGVTEDYDQIPGTLSKGSGGEDTSPISIVNHIASWTGGNSGISQTTVGASYI